MKETTKLVLSALLGGLCVLSVQVSAQGSMADLVLEQMNNRLKHIESYLVVIDNEIQGRCH